MNDIKGIKNAIQISDAENKNKPGVKGPDGFDDLLDKIQKMGTDIENAQTNINAVPDDLDNIKNGVQEFNMIIGRFKDTLNQADKPSVSHQRAAQLYGKKTSGPSEG